MLESSAVAQEVDTKVFTFYSSMCLHEESGDVLGMRIGLIRLKDATYIFFQDSGGWFEPPQIVSLPAGAPKDTHLEFPMRMHDGKKSVFQGTITDAAIDGKIRGTFQDSSGNAVSHLPRAVETDKNFPECK